MSHAGLYIHIPFCQAKCGYCSFNSIPAHRQNANDYVLILQQQAKSYSSHPQVKKLLFDSIFFGGGTPTLASPHQLRNLLHLLLKEFSCTDEVEISIEANPNSITRDDLSILRDAGFNRLSLGIQSFNDQILKTLGRTHSGQQAKQAMQWGRRAGFTNLSCDLIYGLPQQSASLWQEDLEIILEMQPDHLSLYELSVDPGTPFHAKQEAQTLSLPDDDTLADMEDLSKSMLNGIYSQYEISNFATHNHQCRHNLTYWHNGTYLGLGAGAVSCLHGVRFSQQPTPAQFMKAWQQNLSTISHTECLSGKARFRETMIMGLRLTDGINLGQLEQQSGLCQQEVYGTLLDTLIHKGHLHHSKTQLFIPPSLLGVANQILHQLV